MVYKFVALNLLYDCTLNKKCLCSYLCTWRAMSDEEEATATRALLARRWSLALKAVAARCRIGFVIKAGPHGKASTRSVVKGNICHKAKPVARLAMCVENAQNVMPSCLVFCM